MLSASGMPWQAPAFLVLQQSDEMKVNEYPADHEQNQSEACGLVFDLAADGAARIDE